MSSGERLQARTGGTSKKTKRAPGPYDSSQRPRARRNISPPSTSTVTRPPTYQASSLTARADRDGSSSSSRLQLPAGSRGLPPGHNVSRTAPSASTSTSDDTIRSACLQLLQDRYPGFVPKNDFELMALTGSDYHVPESRIRWWLDEQLKMFLELETGLTDPEEDPEAFVAGTQALEARATSVLGIRGAVTGAKPKPGTPNVFCRPIPGSPYSIRLFPGSIVRREYCLDFVHTQTGQPLNTPAGFELWIAPETFTPWLGVTGTMRLRSLEAMFGKSIVRAGEEKFVLRDGQTSILKRPGHKDLRFKVPVRIDGLENADSSRDEDHLEFPEFV
ncbi:hypothetical protein BD311DRAFT_745451 [Dichomitus squalens]|uniref:Uncharacterized protein n=1 Tax=Dichomitus squalens TaxID=114155 RepID=A0A4Q9N7X3_9APHY|nr:hypothetical protein BD311DRAFT_745451 [Dichomitus squalens]